MQLSNAAISKARRGIGGLRLLSRYLPRSSLCEIYKLHIRPHLDYGDVLYHIPTKVYEFRSTNTLPSIMEKIESVQYSAALAVTGAWKGTSRERLYEELGWESLDSQRWTRRLTLFYKIVNKLTPAYMLHSIPPLQQAQYSLRRGDVIGQIRARTERFKSSFYPHCLKEWNILDPQIRNASSVEAFKKYIVSIARPNAKSIFGIYDPVGLPYLAQLRTGLCKLNYYKFKYNFKNTISPMCLSNDGIEDVEHFLLHCSSYLYLRRNLLARTYALIRPCGLANLSSKGLTKLLLYGDNNLPHHINREILQLTLNYIHDSKRFD